MEIVKFGSFYADNIAQHSGVEIEGNHVLSLGDTVPGMEIQWVHEGKMFVADRCACLNVTRDELVKPGGPVETGRKVVSIDGKPYLSRFVGNLWEPLVAAAAESGLPSMQVPDFWRCENEGFWTDTISAKSNSHVAAVIGLGEPSSIVFLDSGLLRHDVGYRPVLEALPEIPLDSKLKRKFIHIHCKGGYLLTGWFQEATDYDITIKPRYDGPCGFPGSRDIGNGLSVIDRSIVLYVCQVDGRKRRTF